MKNVLFAVFAIASGSCVDAQDTASALVAPRVPSVFLTKLYVRESFFSDVKAKQDEAAYFTITNPSGGSSSYSFSFAVGYTIKESVNLRPIFEWQKNSLIEKKQDVMQLGADLQTSLPLKNESWPTPYVIARVNYKDDRVKEIRGAQAAAYATLSFNAKGGRFYPLPDAENKLRLLKFYYNPYVGFEYEGRYRGKDETVEGNTIRFVFRVTGIFHPLHKLLKERLEVIPDFSYRKALKNTTAAEHNENRIVKLAVNLLLAKLDITPAKAFQFKFGINYFNGADPAKGFERQEAVLYTFKVSL